MTWQNASSVRHSGHESILRSATPHLMVRYEGGTGVQRQGVAGPGAPRTDTTATHCPGPHIRFAARNGAFGNHFSAFGGQGCHMLGAPQWRGSAASTGHASMRYVLLELDEIRAVGRFRSIRCFACKPTPQTPSTMALEVTCPDVPLSCRRDHGIGRRVKLISKHAISRWSRAGK
jgi:hypothetical protein